MGDLLKSDKTPYTIFTPFKNNGFKYKVDKPVKNKIKNLTKVKIGDKIIDYKKNPNIALNGGRKNAKKILKKALTLKKYSDTRNILSIPTTRLSAYIKFGCLSIREVYWKIRDKLGLNEIISQLFWREFYTYIAYYFPQVLRGKNFNNKYDGIVWKRSKKNFKAWCKGMTGYPIVDAGMRELNETGMQHNRSRLITSNFLNRILGMDWRLGERYFAQKLIDYDPAVNNGNHQWIASVGVDPKPYFQRLFNPWLQSTKFDKDAKYIKQWIPELAQVPAKDIHSWDVSHSKYKIKYPKPIVDYKLSREDSVKMYRKVLK